MVDIAPELYEAIKKDFEAYVQKDRVARRVAYKATNGKANYIDAHDYAIAVAECLQRAFRKNITEDKLPDGKMYYNIAQRTVRPMLEQMENMVREVSKATQEGLNKEAGLGLKSV